MKKMFLPGLIFIASSSVSILFAELAVRLIDGYAPFSIELTGGRVAPVDPELTAKNLLQRYSKDLSRLDATVSDSGFDSEWFDIDPAPLANRRPLDPETIELNEQVASADAMMTADMFKAWNEYFVQSLYCEQNTGFFDRFPSFVYSYRPSSYSLYPRYRFLPSMVTPLGLVTNSFGFRGDEISLMKPDNTIRIAFIGASTTVNKHKLPFSYPEYIENWLNLWSQTSGSGISFEVINAGREGIGSTDILALVNQELLPLEPDLVVYYEGSNQFSVHELVADLGRYPMEESIEPWQPQNYSLNSSSALYRRVASLISYFYPRKEWPKPAYDFNFPAGIDKLDPPLQSKDLPLNLSTILSDIEAIQLSLEEIDADLILSSFIWMVEDGLELELPKQQSLYDYLNKTFWPVSYRDLREMVDFQNRVLEKFATEQSLTFIDVDRYFPKDSELFSDAVHMLREGIKLRAWITAQLLIPVISEKIGSGELPVPDRFNIAEHPGMVEISRRDLVCPFTEGIPFIEMAGAISLEDFSLSYSEAQLVTGAQVEITTAPERYAYAAEVELTFPESTAEIAELRIEFQVLEGKVQLSVLNESRESFISSLVIEASDYVQVRRLAIPEIDDAGFLLISNAQDEDGISSRVIVNDVRLYLPE